MSAPRRSEQRRPKGRHSRRHETREANDAAREAYETRAERRPRQHWDGTKWVKTNRNN